MTTPTLRIGLVLWSLSGGGVERFVLSLATRLRASGVAAEIVTTDGPGPWAAQAAAQGIPLHDLAGPPGACRPLHARRIARWLHRSGRYDVLLVNCAPRVHAILPLLAEETVVIPVLHLDDPWTYAVCCAQPAAWNVGVAVSPRVQAGVQRVIANRPVLCIPNGIALPPAELLARRRDYARPLRILYLGRVAREQKRVHLLPEILRRTRAMGVDAQLTVVGGGPDLDALRRLVAASGLAEHVTFTGMVAPEAVNAYLIDAHVFLLPSATEGLPFALLEAQACGCVPVVSRLPGITDVATREGKTALPVSPDDLDGYARAIAQLTAAPERWRAMSAAGQTLVREEFSLDVMVDRYRQLIADALAGHYPLPQPRRTQPAFDYHALYEIVSPASVGCVIAGRLCRDAYRFLLPAVLQRAYRAWRDARRARHSHD